MKIEYTKCKVLSRCNVSQLVRGIVLIRRKMQPSEEHRVPGLDRIFDLGHLARAGERRDLFAGVIGTLVVGGRFERGRELAPGLAGFRDGVDVEVDLRVLLLAYCV